MAEPPLEDGALKATEAEALPLVADTAVGAPATVDGMTAAEADEAEPVPSTAVAATVKV